MPAFPMGKMGNCPGPRAQGGPALAEVIVENQRKRGKEKREKRGKNGKKMRKNMKKKLKANKQRNNSKKFLIRDHGGPAP